MYKSSIKLVLITVLALSLSGCLLTRVYAFKEQFCDYQKNFTLRVGDVIGLEMHNPVLYDADVVWLLGAKPTRQVVDGNRLEMVFVVEKDIAPSDPRYAIPLHLVFSRETGSKAGRYRLSKGIIDKNLGTMITPGLIEETVAHTCGSETSVLARNVTVDLSDLDPASIPRRSVIEQALGEANRIIVPGRRVEYRFRLQGAGPEVEKTYAQLWFGADGESVDRVHFRYLRYELDADFVRGIGIISIDL